MFENQIKVSFYNSAIEADFGAKIQTLHCEKLAIQTEDIFFMLESFETQIHKSVNDKNIRAQKAKTHPRRESRTLVTASEWLSNLGHFCEA